eukprot:EG_transcript_35211
MELPQLKHTFFASCELLEEDSQDFGLSSSVCSNDSLASAEGRVKPRGRVSFGSDHDCKMLVQFFDARRPAKCIVHAGNRVDGYIFPEAPTKPKSRLRMLVSHRHRKTEVPQTHM